MRQMRCVAGSFQIRVGDDQYSIAAGDLVDFDRVLVQAGAGRSALTLEDALGPHAQHFEPLHDGSRADRHAAMPMPVVPDHEE